jgi:hypothetical protein
MLARQPVHWVDDDPDDEPIPLSDDTFLYLQAAVVARRQRTALAPREDEPPPWGDDPCPVMVKIRDLSCPLTTTSGYVADHAPAGPDPAEATLYPPPSYLRHDLPTDLGTSLAQILLDAGVVPDDVDAPTIHVTVDVGDTQQTIPRVRAPAQRTDLAMIFDDETVWVRPVEVAVPDTALRSLSRDARESTITELVAACLLAVLPEHHAARAALKALHAEGAVHLDPSRPRHASDPPGHSQHPVPRSGTSATCCPSPSTHRSRRHRTAGNGS